MPFLLRLNVSTQVLLKPSPVYPMQKTLNTVDSTSSSPVKNSRLRPACGSQGDREGRPYHIRLPPVASS